MSKRGYLHNEEAQQRLREREKQQERQHQEDVRLVMSTEAGRRFVWRLMDGVAGVFGETFTGNNSQTLHLEGRRSVGIALMTAAQRIAPGEYVRMLQEQLAARAEDDLHRKDARQRVQQEDDNE